MTRVVINHAAIHRFVNDENGPVARTLLRHGIRVERLAKKFVPVDTGRLRSSIGHELLTDGRGLYVRIGTTVDYAIYVELGTRHMQAQPYLRPALAAVGGAA